jgi:hypothetical protein
VFDKHLPHGPRGGREQEGPIRGAVEHRIAQQPDHGLVDQCRGREGMVLPFAAHHAAGDLAQLVIDQHDELTLGPLVPGPCASEYQAQIAPRLLSHRLSIQKKR